MLQLKQITYSFIAKQTKLKWENFFELSQIKSSWSFLLKNKISKLKKLESYTKHYMNCRNSKIKSL